MDEIILAILVSWHSSVFLAIFSICYWSTSFYIFSAFLAIFIFWCRSTNFYIFCIPSLPFLYVGTEVQAFKYFLYLHCYSYIFWYRSTSFFIFSALLASFIYFDKEAQASTSSLSSLSYFIIRCYRTKTFLSSAIIEKWNLISPVVSLSFSYDNKNNMLPTITTILWMQFYFCSEIFSTQIRPL